MVEHGELPPVRETIITDVGHRVNWLLTYSQLPHPKLKILINNHRVTDFLHVLFEHIGPMVGLSMVYDTIAEAYYDFWAACGIHIDVDVLPMLAQTNGYMRIPSPDDTVYFIEPPNHR